MASRGKEIERLLAELSGGSSAALRELMPLVYEDLRRKAKRILKRESPSSTFTPTDLVHETYLKLAGQQRASWLNESQFFAIAANLMRRILVDHARHRDADKRPPRDRRVLISLDFVGRQGGEWDVVALHEALDRLADFAPHVAAVVELRCFAGCNLNEIAETTGVAVATVKRRWNVGVAWLRKEYGQRHGELPTTE